MRKWYSRSLQGRVAARDRDFALLHPAGQLSENESELSRVARPARRRPFSFSSQDTRLSGFRNGQSPATKIPQRINKQSTSGILALMFLLLEVR